MSYLTTGGPDKEHGTIITSYHQPKEFRKCQKERGDACPYILPTSQNPSCCNPSWLRDACASRKDSKSEWLARDNLENNPMTIKPGTASHVTEQFWVLLPCCSALGRPFPIKSVALSARVSPQTIHFQMLDNLKDCLTIFGPWRKSPFLQQKEAIAWI